MEQIEKGMKVLNGKMGKVEKRLDGVNKRLDRIDKKLDCTDKTLNNLGIKLVNLEERVNNCVTKQEFNEFKNENFARLDQIIGLLQTEKQERIILKNKVDKHDVEIEKIKEAVGMS